MEEYVLKNPQLAEKVAQKENILKIQLEYARKFVMNDNIKKDIESLVEKEVKKSFSNAKEVNPLIGKTIKSIQKSRSATSTTVKSTKIPKPKGRRIILDTDIKSMINSKKIEPTNNTQVNNQVKQTINQLIALKNTQTTNSNAKEANPNLDCCSSAQNGSCCVLCRARRIVEKLEKYKIKYICTDGNYSYKSAIPKGAQHIISKAETCLVESFNARLRHYISCLHRRTMCLAKARRLLTRNVFMAK